ncbi:phospholipase A2 [Megachile rotundata]|uniref:phospholipase A2 n=1 Tax=Megachile rotundata TaxID=143995 RepID=UPI000258F1BE|nr:PREDICTED: phospholipase A2-like [Megachile rotundata]
MTLVRILLFITFLLIVGFGESQDNDNDNNTLKETYVSPLEKSVRLFMKSGRKLTDKIKSIKEDFKEAVSKISILKKKTGARNRTTLSSILNQFKPKIKAIFPGTYWCGDGDISPNNEDLGVFERTDACCRAHDSCPDGIPAEETRGGLLNNGIFTRSPCDCDDAFYQCLKKANNVIAFNIGTTYFNILKPQCFKRNSTEENEDKCREFSWFSFIYNECNEYNDNRTVPEKLEWVDNPKY